MKLPTLLADLLLAAGVLQGLALPAGWPAMVGRQDDAPERLVHLTEGPWVPGSFQGQVCSGAMLKGYGFFLLHLGHRPTGPGH